MASLNLSSNGPAISNSYQKVVNAPLSSGGAASSSTFGQWALFTVQAPLASAFQADAGKESVLKVQTTGEGELIDLIEDFSDGRIQFAFVKVKDPNTTLPKSVLIAWCGEGVPERTKGYFTSHLNAVAKVLHGYHVQITARSESDLTPESIIKKVADSSGAKYSGGGSSSGSAAPAPPVASKPTLPTKSFGAINAPQSRFQKSQTSSNVDADGWGEDAPQVARSQLEKVESAYKPTKVDMASLTSNREPSKYQAPENRADDSEVVKGGYQPIGKVDIAAIRKQAQESGRASDDRPTVVKGAYEPIGKVDIAEIRRKAQPSVTSPRPQEPAATESASDAPQNEDNDRPKTLAERSAAFTQPGRLAELPKPQISNNFGSRASTFGGTKAPAPGAFGNKPSLPGTVPISSTNKAFADEGGKTPAQIWAEKKAKQQGGSAPTSERKASIGASQLPVEQQKSGSWQSGYGGKKWDVQIPSRTGGSAISEQETGHDESEAKEEAQDAPTGNVGSIRDRFKDAAPMGAARDEDDDAPAAAPPLDVSNKPNAASRGVPIPGMAKNQDQDVPSQQRQNLPPPPSRPIPQDEDEEEDDAPEPQGSPVRIAMPVARGATPEQIQSPENSLPEAKPASSLQDAISRHREPESEDEDQPEDETSARAAGEAAAASSFGAATDTRGAGGSGGKEAIAQYDYEKAEDNELELRDGERITNIDMVDDDWWMGQNERGEVGLFPSNYVELVENTTVQDDNSAPASPPPAQQSQPAPPSAPAAAAGKPTATAQYDYEATEDNEISFPDGATITDIEFPDDDWWLGTFDGNTGLFPANYVTLND